LFYLFNHKHLKIHHRTNLIHIFQSQTRRDVRHQLQDRREHVRQKEKEREIKETDKMVSIVRAERDGTSAETRFGLSAKWMSSFKSAGVSVQSTACSRGVRISGQ
jgi:hypothetical protein